MADKAPSNGKKDRSASQPAPSYEASPGPAAPLKVLIVEDEVDLAEVLSITLERLKLQVFHETHGTKALAVYETEHPDLVLLDISLPDVTGWKVLETIREQQRDSKNPIIIIITAYGDPANRLMGKLQGVFSYLVKPFTTDEVEDQVIKALGLDRRK